MPHEEVLNTAEAIFEIIASPEQLDSQKLYSCISFLQYAPPEFLEEYPREAKAIAAAAFDYGASWKQVADAARIDIAEAKRRWANVAAPGTR